VQSFPALERAGVKNRPFVPLDAIELQEIKQLSLPATVLRYRAHSLAERRGRQGVDVPDEQEKQRRKIYSRKAADQLRQIEFIRVGADWVAISVSLAFSAATIISFIQHNDPEFCRFTYSDVARREDGAVATGPQPFQPAPRRRAFSTPV
jgi:hypothetical protein